MLRAERERKSNMLNVFPLLKQLSKSRTDVIFKKMISKFFENKMYIIKEGELADKFFLIVYGECILQKNVYKEDDPTSQPMVLDVLKMVKNDLIGLEAIFKDKGFYYKEVETNPEDKLLVTPQESNKKKVSILETLRCSLSNDLNQQLKTKRRNGMFSSVAESPSSKEEVISPSSAFNCLADLEKIKNGIPDKISNMKRIYVRTYGYTVKVKSDFLVAVEIDPSVFPDEVRPGIMKMLRRIYEQKKEIIESKAESILYYKNKYKMSYKKNDTNHKPSLSDYDADRLMSRTQAQLYKELQNKISNKNRFITNYESLNISSKKRKGLKSSNSKQIRDSSLRSGSSDFTKILSTSIIVHTNADIYRDQIQSVNNKIKSQSERRMKSRSMLSSNFLLLKNTHLQNAIQSEGYEKSDKLVFCGDEQPIEDLKSEKDIITSSHSKNNSLSFPKNKFTFQTKQLKKSTKYLQFMDNIKESLDKKLLDDPNKIYIRNDNRCNTANAFKFPQNKLKILPSKILQDDDNTDKKTKQIMYKTSNINLRNIFSKQGSINSLNYYQNNVPKNTTKFINKNDYLNRNKSDLIICEGIYENLKQWKNLKKAKGNFSSGEFSMQLVSQLNPNISN